MRSEIDSPTNSISNPTENVKENSKITKIPEGAKPKLKDISGIVDERSKGEVIADMRSDVVGE